MVNRRELLGYIMNQLVSRTLEANKRARRKLQCILENDAGPQLRYMYLAQAGNELGKAQDALQEMQMIVAGHLPNIPDNVVERIGELLLAEAEQ